MSATTQFPSADELEAVARQLSTAHDELERVVRRVRIIVRGWENEEKVLDRPTFETIGLLADFGDSVNMTGAEIRQMREEIDGLNHDLMLMRGNLEIRDRKAAA